MLAAHLFASLLRDARGEGPRDRARATAKKLRQQRRRRNAEKPRFNPATVFILLIVAALLVVGLAAAVTGSDPARPRPGAVWSAEHGHWH